MVCHAMQAETKRLAWAVWKPWSRDSVGDHDLVDTWEDEQNPSCNCLSSNSTSCCSNSDMIRWQRRKSSVGSWLSSQFPAYLSCSSIQLGSWVKICRGNSCWLWPFTEATTCQVYQWVDNPSYGRPAHAPPQPYVQAGSLPQKTGETHVSRGLPQTFGRVSPYLLDTSIFVGQSICKAVRRQEQTGNLWNFSHG